MFKKTNMLTPHQISQGQLAIYNGGVQSGSGFVNNSLGKVNRHVKKNRLASKAGNKLIKYGTAAANQQLSNVGHKGYGKKKKRKSRK